MNKSLKFGIVGLGAIARIHAAVLSSIDGVELTSCFHKDGSKADSFASEYGAAGYSDFDLFLSSGIDALAITTPSAIRTEYAIPALERGISVIVEKPMDTDVRRARLMIDAAEKSGARLAVIFQNRFSPLNQEIRKAVSRGRLGRRMLSSCYVKWYRSQEYYDSASWRGTKALDGGGCLMNQAIHALDLLLSLFSPLCEVFAYSALLNHERIDVEDTLVSSLRFCDGSIGSLEASTSSYPGCKRRIELTGSDGTIIAEDDHIITWDFRNMEDEDSRIIARFSSSSSSSASSPDVEIRDHRAEYIDFIDSILSNRKPLVDGSEGLESLMAVNAIYESAKKGEPIRLEP